MNLYSITTFKQSSRLIKLLGKDFCAKLELRCYLLYKYYYFIIHHYHYRSLIIIIIALL